jgi:hypothetical protein
MKCAHREHPTVPPIQVTTTTQTRRLLGLAAGFVVTFLAGDRLIAMVRLPEMTSNTKAPARMLVEHAAMSPAADVVFVGCSYTAFGIDPETVDAEARRQGVELHSLNCGFGGAITLTSTRLCELLLAAPQPPQVIYYELSPGILNTRLPSLRYGVGQVGGWREAAVLWQVSPQDRATAVLSQALSGFYQWNDIRALVECAREGAPLFRPRYERSPRGWLAWTGGEADRAATIAREVARRDGYWGEYNIDDFALAAIVRAAALARAAGVKLRFYEMPMSGAWARVTRDDVEREYSVALATLQAAGCAVPWRCPPGWLSDADFFDADHLTAAGAGKFSEAIAQDVVRLARGDELAAGHPR